MTNSSKKLLIGAVIAAAIGGYVMYKKSHKNGVHHSSGARPAHMMMTAHKEMEMEAEKKAHKPAHVMMTAHEEMKMEAGKKAHHHAPAHHKSSAHHHAAHHAKHHKAPVHHSKAKKH
jgi:hypothetical protein